MTRTAAQTALLLAVAAGALAFRTINLDRRPMHHDEANQAVKCGMLLEDGTYRYDPEDHHGPTLYFLSVPCAWLTGATRLEETSEYTFRMVPALFSAGTILLLLLMRDALGWGGVLCAAVLWAVSPAGVFYGRFYIQESLLVFFTFGALGSGWRYVTSRRVRWAVATGAFLGLMHATKETCVLAYAAMGGALLVCAVLAGRDATALWLRRLRKSHLAACVGTAFLVSFLLFSSFLTNLRGPLDSVLTYIVYLTRASGAGDHTHGSPMYYLRMLTWFKVGGGPAWSEALIVGLFLVGTVVAFASGRPGQANGQRRMVLPYLAAYTLLTTAVYSAIPYKTPWCMLSFLHGMTVVAGVGAWRLICLSKRRAVRCAVGLLLVALTWHLGTISARTSFTYCANPRNPYVYAHTSTDFLKLARRVEDIRQVSDDDHDMLIKVVASPSETWPLPWSLRRYRSVGYWTEAEQMPRQPQAAIIVAGLAQADQMAPQLGDDYLTEYYGLRPDVLLALFIRRDLWDRFLARQQGG